MPVCYPQSTDARRTTASRLTGYNPNGAMVTARGELHVLVIYAGFTNDITLDSPDYTYSGWPQKDATHLVEGTTFPTNAGSISYPMPAPGVPSPFSATATDPTLSNLYYQMSQFSTSPLKMILTPFPKRINVTADDYTSPTSGFLAYDDMVLQALKNDPATQNFDFSPFDQRTNNPTFLVRQQHDRPRRHPRLRGNRVAQPRGSLRAV